MYLLYPPVVCVGQPGVPHELVCDSCHDVLADVPLGEGLGDEVDGGLAEALQVLVGVGVHAVAQAGGALRKNKRRFAVLIFRAMFFQATMENT